MQIRGTTYPWAIPVATTLLVLAVGACSRYQQKPLPIQLPSAYPNSTEVFGATLAAVAYADAAQVKQVFGVDLISAGVFPVQVVFDHRGRDPIEIVAEQTFLVDAKGQLWNILDRNLAYRRIRAETEWGEIAPEAAKGSFLGAAAGAILGAAIGIVSGDNVLETTGKGAALGGGGGAILGGSVGQQDPGVARSIRDDLRTRSLENKPIPPQSLSHGVLFFPGEALGAPRLRLQLRDTKTGEVRIVTLAL